MKLHNHKASKERKIESSGSGCQKGDPIILDIIDISNEGDGIGKTDAFTWFIKDALPGDRVEALVMKTKKSYGFAKLSRILSPSKNRRAAPCPIAGPCGGCRLQSLSYEGQLSFKEKKVADALTRIGRFDRRELIIAPILKMEYPFRYRNKALFPLGVDKNGRLIAGFYAGRTHHIIPCTDCLIGVPENGAILRILLEFMEEFCLLPYDEKTGTGLFRHVLIRKGFVTGQILVCPVINGEDIPRKEILLSRFQAIPGMTSICLCINKTATNVIMGEEIRVLFGPGYIEDFIGDIRFRISPHSFFQINPVQTRRLYEKVLEFAALTGKETVLDLYCGIGSISLFLARKAKRVFGIEVIPQAIEDARTNARENRLDNAVFFVGKAEDLMTELFEESLHFAREYPEMLHPDCIVVDPPRKGCDPSCLESMLHLSPERIVYVSCDPGTLARDLAFLARGGYRIEKVQPVDQFPHTTHVETVCLMSRGEGK